MIVDGVRVLDFTQHLMAQEATVARPTQTHTRAAV
jgi:hypothetical protein